MNRNPVHDTLGRFVRVRQLWDGSNWDDGHFVKGRFRVYRPDYPRAYVMGYANRAHVVYWLKIGKVHPVGTVLHHMNEIKTDDRFENLEVKEHGKHSTDHNTKPYSETHVTRTCEHCGKSYDTSRHRLASRPKEGTRVRFCSQICFYKHPKSPEWLARRPEVMKRAWQTRKGL